MITSLKEGNFARLPANALHKSAEKSLQKGLDER
jgi:hypothetical protein